MLKKKLSPDELASECARIADDIKAENLIVLKVGELTVVADYFVICTGNSSPHLRALSDKIEVEIRKKHKLKPFNMSGSHESGWTVLDYGAVIVHIFSPETRAKYNLEGLWGDAPKLEPIKVLEKKSRGSRAKAAKK